MRGDSAKHSVVFPQQFDIRLAGEWVEQIKHSALMNRNIITHSKSSSECQAYWPSVAVHALAFGQIKLLDFKRLLTTLIFVSRMFENVIGLMDFVITVALHLFIYLFNVCMYFF